MSEINLITPPDKLYNHDRTILLIYPSTTIKTEIQNILLESKKKINIYLYEDQDIDNFPWLLDIHRFVDVCVVNLDNLPTQLKTIESYLISFNNTYYISNGENILFNHISCNKIYNLSSRIIIGETVETF